MVNLYTRIFLGRSSVLPSPQPSPGGRGSNNIPSSSGEELGGTVSFTSNQSAKGGGLIHDIEFNPKKSFNCQARACALLVSLRTLNKLDDALESQSAFIATAYPNPVKRTEAEQADMFDGRERQRA